MLVQRDPPGPELTDCADEPPMPETFADEASRYAWAAAAIFAGRDCRARLGALKTWALQTGALETGALKSAALKSGALGPTQ